MAAVRKILEEIKWGISPEVLAKKHPWEDLASQDPEELLNYARYQRDSQQSYNTLVYLFRVSRDKDLWFSVEVLSQALQHPAMSSEDRGTISRTMRNRLDRIKDEVTARQPSEEKIRKYWLLEASYYAIHGATLAEADRNEEAIEDYQIAEGIFQKLELTQQAENYKHKIERLISGAPRTAPLSEPRVETRPPQSGPLSASFRGTMELNAAGRLPPVQPPVTVQSEPEPQSQSEDSSHYPPAFSVSRPLNPDALQSGALPHLPDREGAGIGLPSNGSEGTHVPPSNGRSNPEETPPAAVETAVQDQAGEPQFAGEIYPEAASPEIEPELQDSASVPETREQLATQSADLARLTQQIEEQNEALKVIQLEVHMYQERRSLLFREVQTLEKKAAYLKEVCSRLERKSDKLEKSG